MQSPAGAPLAEGSSAPPPPPSPLDPSASLRSPSPATSRPSPDLQGLSDFRASEGTANRRSKLRSLFDSIPIPGPLTESEVQAKDDEKSREENRKIYARELWGKCSGDSCGVGTSTVVADSELQWPAFKRYAEEKEHELWRLFVELNGDGNMRLRKEEVKEACKRAGVEVDKKILDDFFKELDRNGDGFIEFGEWRDFLILLPRRASMTEILMYYQTHRLKRPSMSQLTQDGDVVVGRGKTGWNKLLGKLAVSHTKKTEGISLREQDKNDEQRWAEQVAVEGRKDKGKGREQEEDDEEEEPPHEGATHGMFAGAGKFLLAGGVAGAVSRTATAPFDRLKVYLITTPSTPTPTPPLGSKAGRRNKGSIPAAVRVLWRQGGGLQAFWTGNGLNVVKIFPESAIKFLSYESAKRVFAEYWDDVPDQTQISNSSRFIAGGIGGVVSQFVIYPIETLKTRVMSSTGGALHGNVLIARTASEMWRTGGIRLYFKGLTAGLIGVFPYSAIDMSTFEGIKLAYTKWSGREPGIAGSLAFGALSGGIGATSVYPLNLLRTRLQAQGTPAHPQTYLGVKDAAWKCYRGEGWKGFYKGLTPTLVKVVPAVAISYAVYDASKKVLFGAEDPETLHDHDSEES